MTKIAIIGPGAIGGTIAAWLNTKANNEISICARSSFDTLIVDTPFGTLESTPTVFTDPTQATQVDWVIITTKAYQVASLEPWLKQLCHADTKVAIAQNGVEHIANLTPFIPAQRIVPIIIDTPAARTAIRRPFPNQKRHNQPHRRLDNRRMEKTLHKQPRCSTRNSQSTRQHRETFRSHRPNGKFNTRMHCRWPRRRRHHG